MTIFINTEVGWDGTDRKTERQTERQNNGWLDKLRYRTTDRQHDGWMDGWIGGRTDGKMRDRTKDTLHDRMIERWRNGWMDIQNNKQIKTKKKYRYNDTHQREEVCALTFISVCVYNICICVMTSIEPVPV